MTLPAQPNQSLIGGLDCLLTVASAASPLGSREVARLLGMEHTRASRLLGTLCHLGVLQRTPSRKYAPGPAIHVLAAQSLRGSGILPRALPALRRLRAEKGRLIVALGVLWKRHVCYLVYAAPHAAVEESLAGHDLYPAEKSSIGQVLLASKSAAELREAYAVPGQGPGVPEGLPAQLAHVRRQGFAVLEENRGRRTVAVPLGLPPQAALALSGAIDADEVADTVRLLRAIAAEIIPIREN